MWRGKRLLAIALGASSAWLPGCKDACDPDTVQRASAFLDAHQSCETDHDCVVVSDYCGELPGGFCGQLPMNRAGAASDEWERVNAELTDCGPDTCAVCAAALVPTCSAGSCRRPQ